MKKRDLHLTPLFTLATCFFALLCLPSVSSASSPPADSVSFCAPFDYEQWRRDHPRPAAKPLADLNVGEPLTVRLIYFLPSDRSPQQDIDAKMDEVMKNVQLSYEEVMEYHGFGRKTFRFETDATGKAVVHHVRGKFNDEYYHTDTFNKVIHEETAEQFDPSRNIYLIVLDVSTATIDVACGRGGADGPEGGVALIPAPNSARQRERGWSCFNVDVAAHELGHAFGLAHDHFRNATRSPSSYHTDWMVTSFCAAEWLDAHRYFNIDQTYPEEDEPTTIQMLPPLAVPPYAIRLRFEVTDPDGLHQAQLHNSTGDAIDCQGISSESASVEFVTLEVTEDPGNRVGLRVVDVYGNVTRQSYPIDITAVLPPEVVSIPDANLAAAVREALDLTPGDAISQLDLLKLGGLEANDRQITDLTGLEYAVNLKGLLLGDNQISDITPLAKSTILEGLELYNNNISDISSLAEMTNLTSLNLDGNSVSDLSPLVELTNLRGLGLRDNSVSDLSPVAGLIHLRGLALNNNNISDISSLAAMTHLTSLNLDGNSVSDLSPLAKLTNLTELWLNDNNISDLSPLVKLTNLTELWLNDNNISDLSPLVKLTNLRALGFDDNNISDLSPLARLTNLTYLALVRNSVSDLSPLAKLTNLTELWLDNNSVSDLSPLAKLIYLVKLELGANQISDITPLAGLTILESLQLYGNNISDLSPLAELTDLTNLYIKLGQRPLALGGVNQYHKSGTFLQQHLGYLIAGSDDPSDIFESRWQLGLGSLAPGSKYGIGGWRCGLCAGKPPELCLHPHTYSNPTGERCYGKP